ncbi:universal stress protein [Halocalculus aciditolerans]|uniref:Universal stress protein n=1 Tax=Halocalculus aciditolerans TaxID=1383812 RepID=A0A830F7G2_9EURY|nr:universal stress protein [Halocalculus aciditolerans]GGL47150.1 universal stress protein [Halocalculus aciditolerans]
MQILAPIDGSDCSFRALTFACGMAKAYGGDLHVVHITDVQNEATEEILDRARGVLDAEGVDGDPEVTTDLNLSSRPSKRVGEDILELVEEEGYDHIVMGHHGQGRVERLVLGSAASTVLESNKIPATIIP